MLAKNIREQILARAKGKNLSIMALEEKSGLKHSAVGNIIANRSLNPQIETLAAIAKTLECTINDLISDPYDTKPQMQRKEQEDCEFDELLFQEVVQQIINSLRTKRSGVALNRVMIVLKEAYMFFLTKKNKIVDPELIEWLIDKNH